ncbi:Alpha-1B adrenergic receptor [Hypsibius exemplaris]|uniref:Alpha-1B adrenergic receptor n=1 Tax=Hypsibius exemplaris TaxID=2072580 RepID=A0A1W0X0G4_HYPEX|nr:Alpha-1B adrenergic receptor [Hypsibius exemplaris]
MLSWSNASIEVSYFLARFNHTNNSPFLAVHEDLHSPTYSAAASNNSDSDSEYRFTTPELSYAVPVGILLGVFTVLTVCGNLLVLVAVATDKQLRSQRHTLLIANLAIFDMTLGWSVFPFSASLEFLNDQWIFGRVFCSIWAAVDVLCCTGSIWSLVSIALDRLVGVTRPLAYAGIMTRRKMVYMIIIIWGLSLAISVVPFMGWSKPEQRNPFKCDLQTDISYVLFSCAVSYYIPLVIILALYSRIYRAAARHIQSLRSGVKRGSVTNADGSAMTLRIHTKKFMKSTSALENSNTNESTGSSSKFGKTFAKQRKATITLTTIIVGFIMMWQGFFLILPLSVLCPDSCHIPVILWKILFWLGYCNSLMNPFIYATASPEFRRAFKRILCCAFLYNSKRKRNLRYEMSISSVRNASNNNNNTTVSSATSDSERSTAAAPPGAVAAGCFQRLCHRPCPTPNCLSSSSAKQLGTTAGAWSSPGETSDTGSVCHLDTGRPHANTLPSSANNAGKGRNFMGFRNSFHKHQSSSDLMRDFPLASLTLARLKNPNSNGDSLYGSLQALQKAALEQSPSRVRHNSIVIVTNGLDVPLMTASRSCATQTPPVSISASPETSSTSPWMKSPYRYGFEPVAPDDAEL